MTTTSISESHVSVDVGSVPNDHKCFVVSDLAAKKVDIIKGYDERIRKTLSSMTDYDPSYIDNLAIGETLHFADHICMVTRIS